MTIHNFQQQLDFSQKASHEAFWVAAYRRAFPNMISHMACPGDFLSQRMGIDRVIALSNGRLLRVDEKKRDKDYPDILLEYLSNDKTNAPGWMEKDLFIDYLAYAFMPSRRVYFFDWLMLRRAWARFKGDWLKYADDSRNRHYRRVRANNDGYSTWSVAVPIKVLQDAVKLATTIQLTDAEITNEQKAA